MADCHRSKMFRCLIAHQDDAVTRCGPNCLWVDQMACPEYADVLLLSDTRRDILPGDAWLLPSTTVDFLSANILPHLDLVANFRLHGDIPNTIAITSGTDEIGTPRMVERNGKIIHHVTVTYTPGNLEMYKLRQGTFVSSTLQLWSWLQPTSLVDLSSFLAEQPTQQEGDVCSLPRLKLRKASRCLHLSAHVCPWRRQIAFLWQMFEQQEVSSRQGQPMQSEASGRKLGSGAERTKIRGGGEREGGRGQDKAGEDMTG
eukprot:230468-Hanusia_phi.AAC.1